MLKIRASDLKQFIREALDGPIQIESWVGADGAPSKPDNFTYPTDHDAEVPIDPKTSDQVVDTNLPVDDPKWSPRSRMEMGMALKQLSEHIPEGQFQFVWARVKNIIDKALENTDMTRSPSRIEDLDSSLAPQPTPEQKPKLQA